MDAQSPTLSPPANFPLLTEQEVAVWLAVSVKTLRNWRVSGSGPKFIKLGRAVRYSDVHVAEYVVLAARYSTSVSR